MLALILCRLNRPQLIVVERWAGGHDFRPTGVVRALVCKHCRKDHP